MEAPAVFVSGGIGLTYQVSMKLDLNRAVLLPIDMQQAFDSARWPRRWNDKVDANGLALLAAWRTASDRSSTSAMIRTSGFDARAGHAGQ